MRDVRFIRRAFKPSVRTYYCYTFFFPIFCLQILFTFIPRPWPPRRYIIITSSDRKRIIIHCCCLPKSISTRAYSYTQNTHYYYYYEDPRAMGLIHMSCWQKRQICLILFYRARIHRDSSRALNRLLQETMISVFYFYFFVFNF